MTSRVMAADDGVSGAGVYADVLPGLTADERDWLWADGSGADAAALLVTLGRLRIAACAFLAALDAGRSYREELAALREAVG